MNQKIINACVGIFAGSVIFSLFFRGMQKFELNGLKNELEIIRLKKELENEKFQLKK